MLEVKNLTVSVAGRRVINGLELCVDDGEVAALMGPNGSGKSTLAYALAGREGYAIESGDVRLNGESLLEEEPESRAAKGLFLAFQHPVEIPGVATMTFLRAALNALRKRRGEDELSTPEFMKRVKKAAGGLGITQEMLKRSLNAGFSGGEKKRMDVLQMTMLEPSFAILDETDSGLDIDALRTVAGGINALRTPKRGFLVITHYQRLLDYVVPDTVHVMAQGKIVRSGSKELALELEKSGYRDYAGEQAAV